MTWLYWTRRVKNQAGSATDHHAADYVPHYAGYVPVTKSVQNHDD